MLAFIKNHPFAVEAFFKNSLVITYAVPKEQLEPLLPSCLTLDIFNNKWAFIAVALVQTKHLRPKGFPKIFGNDFSLIGYRVFVRYTNKVGKNLRGLYILKSETDKKKMAIFGNLFTHYNYSRTDIRHTISGDERRIVSKRSGFELVVEDNGDNVSLPVGSPFADWKEARRFAGPLPFTFTYTAAANKVLIIEGVRKNWAPRPVKVIKHSFSFVENLKLQNMKLANAFVIDNIPYCWKKGKVEIWNEEKNSRAS